MTFLQDGIMSLTPRQFVAVFDAVRAGCLRPAVQWTSFQILTRTLWTNLKESKTNRAIVNGNLGHCLNCFSADESTLHLMYHCRVAGSLIDCVLRVMNRIFTDHYKDPFPIVKSVPLVMFSQVPGVVIGRRVRPNLAANTDVNDVFSICKHILYVVRFRDNADEPPGEYRLLIDFVEELRKLKLSRFYSDVNSSAIHKLYVEFKQILSID